MGYIGQDEDHLESPGTPSCDSLQTSNPMQSSGARLPRRSLATARAASLAGRAGAPPRSPPPQDYELTQKPVYELCEKCDERLRDDQRDWYEAERLLLDDTRIVAG